MKSRLEDLGWVECRSFETSVDVTSGVGRIFCRAVHMLDVQTMFAWRREFARNAHRSAEIARSAHRGAESARSAESRRKAPSEIGGRGLGRGLGEPLPKKIFEILKVQRCNLEAFGSVILLV